MKKLIALALALLMLLSMASIASAEEPRHIVIGTTWDIFYDSTHTDVYDNPGYDPADPEAAAAALDVRDNEEALGWWYGVTAKDIDL